MTKTRVRVNVHYCAGAGGRVFRFAEDLEVEFTVKDADGVAVWQSVLDYPPTAAAHDKSVRAGDCVGWSQLWLTRTNDGVPVPAGDYTLHPRIRAEGAPEVPVTSFRFPRS